MGDISHSNHKRELHPLFDLCLLIPHAYTYIQVHTYTCNPYLPQFRAWRCILVVESFPSMITHTHTYKFETWPHIPKNNWNLLCSWIWPWIFLHTGCWDYSHVPPHLGNTVLETGPRILCMLGKRSVNWVTAPNLDTWYLCVCVYTRCIYVMYIYTFYTNIFVYNYIYLFLYILYMYTHIYLEGFKTVFLWLALNVLELTL